ncbi:MAG: hypothetical protein LBR54_04910 [Oscillospiraceae bacterium]|jgi:hypothetical protein|nr:hypothetical protein [Oscillospiraceae bacterium]
MTGKDFINEITSAKMPDRERVRENCLQQSEAVKRTVSRAGRSIAACACGVAVIICTVIFGLPLLNNTPPPVSIDSQPAVTNADNSGISENSSNNSESALYVPKMELHEPQEGVEVDMLGLFVYQGRIYTQSSDWIYDEEAVALRGLVGEKLGYAKGNINEWSKQSDYATEFAGSIKGDIYTVNGYSKEFRLCTTGYSVDENDAEVPYIVFYDNLNGIVLTTGADLFGESRINLAENWRSVKYQTHENWDSAPWVPEYENLPDITDGSISAFIEELENAPPEYGYENLPGITDGNISAFIEELENAPFEYVYQTVGADFYDTDKQAHLFFTMKDGTTAELRLIEGGYAGYRHLGWYFVKMPGEVFDLIYNACQ